MYRRLPPRVRNLGGNFWLGWITGLFLVGWSASFWAIAVASPHPWTMAFGAQMGFLGLLILFLMARRGLRPLPAEEMTTRRRFLSLLSVVTMAAVIVPALLLLRTESVTLWAVASAVLLVANVGWAYWTYNSFGRLSDGSTGPDERSAHP